jgi:predicted DsbA family dithiol-disulfide isomerase
MSGDNGLASVNTLMVNYGITELPTILINEKIKVTGIITLEELDKIIKNEMGGEGILKLN